jgi:serine O-acetyltransferase
MRQLKADRHRLETVLANWQQSPKFSVYFHPSFLCVLFYRLSRHFFLQGHSLLARLIAQFNGLLTGADINPESDIDEGFVVLSPSGAAMYGKVGKNLTVMPCSGIGGELGRREDIGGGPGLPVLGDDVVLESHTGVLGPVRIGNRVRVTAGTLVTQDVPDDTVVEGPPPRLFPRKHS